MNDPNVAFTLRIPLFGRGKGKTLVIVAYDDLGFDYRGAVQLTCEVRHGGKIIFPRGQLTCALSPGKTSDGIHARELVMSLVAMAPDAGSGVDDDYWEGYTPEQIAWVNEHWEALDMERSDRYCNPEDGSVRS